MCLKERVCDIDRTEREQRKRTRKEKEMEGQRVAKQTKAQLTVSTSHKPFADNCHHKLYHVLKHLYNISNICL